MLKSYKYRIYPTPEQQTLINKTFGCCRFIYNLALETKNYAYATHRKNLSCFDLINQLPELKKENGWLKEVDSQALQQSITNLDKAFTSFFKGTTKFPNFKKKQGTESYRIPNGNLIKINRNKLVVPKFQEGIKMIIDREIIGKIKHANITRTSTDKFFVSILVDTNDLIPKKKQIVENKSIGIDLGLSHFLIMSDGTKIDNPKYLRKSLGRLKFFQKQVSRKKKGSLNKKKAIKRVNIIHEKIVNQRNDFLHKISDSITKKYDTVCFEDLQINNMVKNHKLALSINDAAWGRFVQFVKYKAEWRGKNVLQIPTFQPSTKICSNCGFTNRNLTLADREWKCPKCEINHDRDVNAAINIKKYCINQINKETCGGSHRGKFGELPSLVGAMNQKDSKELLK